MLLGAIETTGLQEYSPLRVSLALTANANHGERILSAFTFSPEASLHLIAFKFLIHFAHDVTPIAASEFLRNKQQLRRLALGDIFGTARVFTHPQTAPEAHTPRRPGARMGRDAVHCGM